MKKIKYLTFEYPLDFNSPFNELFDSKQDAVEYCLFWNDVFYSGPDTESCINSRDLLSVCYIRSDLVRNISNSSLNNILKKIEA